MPTIYLQSDGNEQKELVIDDMGSQTTSSSRKNSVLFENTKSSHTQSYGTSSKSDEISEDFSFPNYQMKSIDTTNVPSNPYSSSSIITPSNKNLSSYKKNEFAKHKNEMRSKVSLDPNSLFKPLVQVLKANPTLAATFRGMLKPPR